MFQGRARCSLNCLGVCSLKHKGTESNIYQAYTSACQKNSQGGKLNIKKAFQLLKEMSGKKTTSLHSSVQGVYSVCIRAFHQMKAWLRFVDIRNNVLRVPKFPSVPSRSQMFHPIAYCQHAILYCVHCFLFNQPAPG